LKLHSQRPGRSLQLVQHVSHRGPHVRAGMPEGSHAGDPGNGLLEQLEAFGD
jgi:hypothetical protein